MQQNYRDDLPNRLAPATFGVALTLSGLLTAASAKIGTGLNVGSGADGLGVLDGVICGSNGTDFTLAAYDEAGGGTYKPINYDASTHTFKTSGTDRLLFSSGGITPSVAGGQSMGSASNPFDVVAGRRASFGAGTMPTPAVGEIVLSDGSNGLIRAYDSGYRNLNHDALSYGFKVSGTERWTLDASGHVKPFASNTYDIGTQSLAVRRAYVWAMNLGSHPIAPSSPGDLNIGVSGNSQIRGADASGATLLGLGGSAVQFNVASSEVARFHTNGFLGILSTAPTAPITIRNNWITSIGQIRLESTTQAGWSSYDQSGNLKGTNYRDNTGGAWNWNGTGNDRTYYFDDGSASSVATALSVGTSASLMGFANQSFQSANLLYSTTSNWVRQTAQAAAGYIHIGNHNNANYASYQFAVNSNTSGIGTNPSLIPLATLGYLPGIIGGTALWFNNVTPTTGNYTIRQDAGGTTYVEALGNTDVYLRNASGATVLARSNIGSAFAWDVSGACHASSFPVSSDRRFKDNIEELPDALDRAMKIPVVTFDWNDLHRNRMKRSKDLGGSQLGVIAQDVAEVAPWVVSRWGDNPAEGRDYTDKRDPWYAVDYGRLGVLTLGALQQYVTRTDPRIAALEQEVAALRSQIGKAA